MSVAVGAPTDAQLLDALEPAVGPIRDLRRAPYEYATSFPLEEVELALDDRAMVLIFKDLAWERLFPEARDTKPRFLYDPRRTIETHRRLLDPIGVGPRCVAAMSENDCHWLFCEKVDGVELWKAGELATWESVARWLSGFHARYAGKADVARAANPHLLEHNGDLYLAWADRARAALRMSDDARAAALLDRLDGYGAVAEQLASAEPTLLHGELYASNVLVSAHRGGDVDVWPVDWELAATGPAVIDLAALTSGWSAQVRGALVDAYAEGARTGTVGDLRTAVTCARLHLALQWIGWSLDWQPPPEHARDWVGDALDAAGQLEL